MPVTVTKDITHKVRDAIDGLTSKRVMVGVPSEKDPRKRSEPIGNAALAYIHENGAPEVNIPARPFLVPGVKRSEKDWLQYLRRAGETALNGNASLSDRNLGAAGLTAQNAVRAVINAGVPPPLKPSTIAARRRRGRTGTVPLIDTGQLRNSITYVIRKVKK